MAEHEHGTIRKYDKGKCRCDLCRAANREYQGFQRARRRQRLQDDPGLPVAHGKATTYSNWACRCDPCVGAHKEAMKLAAASRHERTAAGDQAVPHGTRSGYTAWGCRCDGCLEVGRSYERARVAAGRRRAKEAS